MWLCIGRCIHAVYTIVISGPLTRRFEVPNPTYADLVVKSDDINMENNPAYQCSSKQDDVKDHHYEAINVDDKVIKPVN